MVDMDAQDLLRYTVGGVIAYLSVFAVFLGILLLAVVWTFRRSRRAVDRHHAALADEEATRERNPEPDTEPEPDSDGRPGPG